MKFLLPAILALAIFFGFVLEGSTSKTVDVIANEKITGMSVVSGPTDVEVEQFKSINTQSASEWVAILPYASSRLNNPAVHYNTSRQWWGETIEGTYSYVRKAQDAGLKVMIKPQIWVPQSWTGGLTYENPEDWEEWEKDYEQFIMDYAIVADSMKAEMLCIGTELKLSVAERPDFWINLIPKIKQVYNGKITYAANWDNFENIPFWDQLDFIGVDAYFPLSEDKKPKVKSLVKAWEGPYRSIKDISEKCGKPILFTEYGYLSVDGAAGKTWELEKNRRSRQHNQDAQAIALEALFQKFWNEPWFGGGFAWKWHPTMSELSDRLSNDYTPQGKKSLEVFQKWYGSSQN